MNTAIKANHQSSEVSSKALVYIDVLWACLPCFSDQCVFLCITKQNCCRTQKSHLSWVEKHSERFNLLQRRSKTLKVRFMRNSKQIWKTLENTITFSRAKWKLRLWVKWRNDVRYVGQSCRHIHHIGKYWIFNELHLIKSYLRFFDYIDISLSILLVFCKNTLNNKSQFLLESSNRKWRHSPYL